MSAFDTNNLPPVIGPTTLPAGTPAAPAEAPAAEQDVVGFVPSSGNSSGLLQNFILPKTTLDALGLLRPSNQGDSEVLVSQAFLTAERLADENEAANASALSAMAATQASILAAFQLRLAALEAANTAAQGTIAGNNAQLNAIGAEIGQVSQDLDGLRAEQQSLNDQIAALENTEPQTGETAAELVALRRELAFVNAQISELNGTLDALQDDVDRLDAENARLSDEIEARQETIDAQSELVVLISGLFDRFVTATDGQNRSVDEAQEDTVIETNEVVLEEILPNMQQIFEIDLEDIGLETIIGDTRLDDRAAEEAVALSFGLVGSFFESLGVFLQLSNLIELDLDSTAFGNNKTQRMQISV